MERLDTLVSRYKELMMASFEKIERDIRLNHQGYNLWQKGSYYPSRVLMLDCPHMLGNLVNYHALYQQSYLYFHAMATLLNIHILKHQIIDCVL